MTKQYPIHDCVHAYIDDWILNWKCLISSVNQVLTKSEQLAPISREIRAYFLLSIYLIVVAHLCISHTHVQGIDEDPIHSHEHVHHDSEEGHHEHLFHIGVFHLLGHLFECFSHIDDSADDHLMITASPSGKKWSEDEGWITMFFAGESVYHNEIDAESLTSPPESCRGHMPDPSLTSRPLRAPPKFI